MKIKPKLPVCPHCNAIYRYNEVKNISKYKNIECRHCGKIFTVCSKKGKLIYFSIVAAVLIFINILMMNFFMGFTIYHCLAVTIIIFGLSLFYLPYTVKFKKWKDPEDN